MTGSGTGTPLSSYPTLATIIAIIRLTLASAEDWPDTTLAQWVSDAVRFYMAIFPYTPDGALITPPTQPTDYVMVPDHHLEAIYQYVQYRATTELMHDEAVTVDTSNVSIVLSQLTDTSRAMWSRYKDVMDKLAWEARGQSAAIPWNTDRIY